MNDQVKKPMEYVVAIHRQQLLDQGIAFDGFYDITEKSLELDPEAFALLPRAIAGNKTDEQLAVGKAYPQLIAYMMLRKGDRVLCYRRKSKDPSLLGKLSIGVGGHVDQSDIQYPVIGTNLHGFDFSIQNRTVTQALQLSLAREVFEETGVNITDPRHKGFESYDYVIASDIDKTASIHVGFCNFIDIAEDTEISVNPEEFIDPQWYTMKELEAMLADPENTFEPWSQMLIENL